MFWFVYTFYQNQQILPNYYALSSSYLELWDT